jgi:hypothetical protein
VLWVYTHNRRLKVGVIINNKNNKNMPRFNGTGPLGTGPGTGWGMGPCGAGMSWRRGRGRGFGRFWGYGPYQFQVSKKEETEMLADEAELLEEELKTVKQRLAELRAKK